MNREYGLRKTVMGIVLSGMIGLLSACGSGGGGSVAATSAAPTIVPRFAYAANFNDGTVSMYTVNAATGQLRHNGYAVAGANPISVSVDPGGKFAYVANRGTSDVSAYTIGVNGTLTQIACSVGCSIAGNFQAGTSPWSVTIDPSGKFAYVANNFNGALGNSISAYTINVGTGVLTAVAGSPFVAGVSPISVTIDPTGKFAYAANYGSSDVSAYLINTSTGALTPIDADPNTAGIQNFLAGANPMSVTIDPTGKFAYVANSFNGGITGNSVMTYAINPASGMLTTIGFISSGGTQPQSVTVHPSGKFAYVTNYLSGGVTGYSIGSTGVLAMLMQPVGGWATGTNPYGVTIDPSGKFAYVANQGSNDVSTYGINPDGTLTIAGRSAGRSGNLAMAMTHGTAAVTYTPKFAYAANQTTSDISAYSINVGTGTLTSLGAAVGTTTSPGSVTVDPSGKFAYVGGNLAVMVHLIHADGTLGSGATAAAVATQSVTVDPSGRFAFVADRANNMVFAYTINSSTGALANAGAGVGTGTTPRSVTVDPSGRFAYVANSVSGDVSAYSIAPTTGALTSVGAAVAAGTTSWSVSVDPSGRFAYVANAGSNDVSAYIINAATGALSSVGAAVAAGTTPISVSVDPSGKFAYVANYGSNNVSAYTINPGTGALTSVGAAVAAGTGPASVTTTGAIQ